MAQFSRKRQTQRERSMQHLINDHEGFIESILFNIKGIKTEIGGLMERINSFEFFVLNTLRQHQPFHTNELSMCNYTPQFVQRSQTGKYSPFPLRQQNQQQLQQQQIFTNQGSSHNFQFPFATSCHSCSPSLSYPQIAVNPNSPPTPPAFSNTPSSFSDDVSALSLVSCLSESTNILCPSANALSSSCLPSSAPPPPPPYVSLQSSTPVVAQATVSSSTSSPSSATMRLLHLPSPMPPIQSPMNSPMQFPLSSVQSVMQSSPSSFLSNTSCADLLLSHLPSSLPLQFHTSSSYAQTPPEVLTQTGTPMQSGNRDQTSTQAQAQTKMQQTPAQTHAETPPVQPPEKTQTQKQLELTHLRTPMQRESLNIEADGCSSIVGGRDDDCGSSTSCMFPSSSSSCLSSSSSSSSSLSSTSLSVPSSSWFFPGIVTSPTIGSPIIFSATSSISSAD